MSIDTYLCWDLKTGVIIIGWIHCFVSVLATVFILAAAISITKQPDDELLAGFMWFAVFSCIIFAIVPAILLILGARKENHRYMIFWLIVNAFGNVMTAIHILTAASNSKTPEQISGMFVGFIFNSYHFFVVRALYIKLKNNVPMLPLTNK